MSMRSNDLLDMIKNLHEVSKDMNSVPSFKFLKAIKQALDDNERYQDLPGQPDFFDFIVPDKFTASMPDDLIDEAANLVADMMVNVYQTAEEEFGTAFAIKVIAGFSLKS